MELKPALSFDKQIDRLEEEHGLRIEDRAFALGVLSRVNYYRLSAYGIGLKKTDDPDKYIENISLEHLYNLYLFDSYLRSALLLIIEQIEIELRTQIAYYLSLEYGPEGYMNGQNFRQYKNSNGRLIHEVIISNFKEEIERQTALPCVKHHKQKYNGRFPAWAAVELFSFGMLSSIYSIMNLKDQRMVSAFYGLDARHLSGWIQSLVEVRNRCAHYGRIYNMPLAKTPFLFSEYAVYKSNRLFPIVLIIGRLMRGKPCWNTFKETLIGLIDTYSEVRLDYIGFPTKWKEIMEAIK